MDGYERLASAVVAQAEMDYITCHRLIKEHSRKIKKLEADLSRLPRNRDAIMKRIGELELKIEKLRYEIDEIINFFNSSRFRIFSDKNPERLISKLEEIVNDS